jgi:hypothetical protein
MAYLSKEAAVFSSCLRTAEEKGYKFYLAWAPRQIWGFCLCGFTSWLFLSFLGLEMLFSS